MLATVLNRLFWISLVLALAVYGAMVGWSLPRIAAEAGGLAAFDLRPLGYSYDEAVAFLARLSPAGHSFYLEIQHRLDSAYPILLALTLASGTALLVPPRLGSWKWLLAATALPGMVFDYRENALVAELLTAPPDAIDPALVASASLATQIKSLSTAVATLIFLILLVWALRRRMLQS